MHLHHEYASQCKHQLSVGYSSPYIATEAIYVLIKKQEPVIVS